jgi:hypothetical protein
MKGRNGSTFGGLGIGVFDGVRFVENNAFPTDAV